MEGERHRCRASSCTTTSSCCTTSATVRSPAITSGKDAAIQVLVEATQRSGRQLDAIEDVLGGDTFAALVVREGVGDPLTVVRRVFLYKVRDGKLAECWLYDEDQRFIDASVEHAGGRSPRSRVRRPSLGRSGPSVTPKSLEKRDRRGHPAESGHERRRMGSRPIAAAAIGAAAAAALLTPGSALAAAQPVAPDAGRPFAPVFEGVVQGDLLLIGNSNLRSAGGWRGAADGRRRPGRDGEVRRPPRRRPAVRGQLELGRPRPAARRARDRRPPLHRDVARVATSAR